MPDSKTKVNHLTHMNMLKFSYYAMDAYEPLTKHCLSCQRETTIDNQKIPKHHSKKNRGWWNRDSSLAQSIYTKPNR